MAKNKYYGVRKGKTIGIFTSWDQCKTSVDGYPGAEYKGFASLKEAEAYVGVAGYMEIKEQQEEHLVVYVDGSYSEAMQKYAFGCIFIVPDGKIYTEFGNGDNPRSLQHKNVTGEMLGAMYAVKTAMFNGFDKVEIRYDYEGIEKWVTGAWQSKTEYTQKYTSSMREWERSIQILFTKVAAHTNVEFNELADKMAKKGLTEGNGIPKIRKLEELTQWNRCD